MSLDSDLFEILIEINILTQISLKKWIYLVLVASITFLLVYIAYNSILQKYMFFNHSHISLWRIKYRVAEKYGHVVWRCYSTIKLRKSKLIFLYFVAHFIHFLLIYYSFTFDVSTKTCVHRLAIAQQAANEGKISKITSRLKVPLCTVHKVM